MIIKNILAPGLVTRSVYNYFETMVATIYSPGTIILLQLVFAIVALLIHTIMAGAVNLGIPDIFKVLYNTWFIFDLIKLFPVKMKFIRATSFIILAFSIFTLWRLYWLPAVLRRTN